MSGGACRTEYGTGAMVAGEDYALHYNPDRLDGTARLIIAGHGHNDTAKQMLQTHSFTGRHARALVATGRYMVLSISAGGTQAWGGPSAQSAYTAAVTWAATRGAKTGKYGLYGYSMCGIGTMNRIKRDAANIAGAWLWSPVTDLTWAKDASAGWATEINTAYGSWAATAGYRMADEPATYAALTVPVKIAHPTDDSVVPYSQSTSFVAAVGTSYITMRTPDITGDHTGQMQNVPDAEIVAFYDSLSW